MHYLYLYKAKDFLVKVQKKGEHPFHFPSHAPEDHIVAKTNEQPILQAMKKLDSADLLPDIWSLPRLYHGSLATARPGGQHWLHEA